MVKLFQDPVFSILCSIQCAGVSLFHRDWLWGQGKVWRTCSIIKGVLSLMRRLSVSTNHSPPWCWVMGVEMGNECCYSECSGCKGCYGCWCSESHELTFWWYYCILSCCFCFFSLLLYWFLHFCTTVLNVSFGPALSHHKRDLFSFQ